MSSECLMLNENTVYSLLRLQWPEYKNKSIIPSPFQGHDNLTFLLDSNLIASFPKKELYSKGIMPYFKLQKILAKYIPVKIPEIIFIGTQSDYFPYHWSIKKYIQGNTLNLNNKSNKDKLNLARQLLDILKSFQEIAIDKLKDQNITPSQNNWFRGGHIAIYQNDFHESINYLKMNNISLSYQLLIKNWELAMHSSWKNNPIFVHGDIAPNNIIMNNTD